jgi:signal transduction histidine kinase
MSLRTRMIATHVLLTLVPLLVLGWLLRGAVAQRLNEQYDRRVDDLLEVVEERLASDRDRLAGRLEALGREAEADQGLLLALAGLRDRGTYPQEFAETGRRVAGLDLLQLVDTDGQLVADGSSPTRLGDDARPLVRALRANGAGVGLIETGDGELALVLLDSLRIGDRSYHLIGGDRFDADYLASLAGARDVSASLVYHGGALVGDPSLAAPLERAGEQRLDRPERVVPAHDYLVRATPFPRLARTGAVVAGVTPRRPLVPATLVLTHPRGPWQQVLADLDRWLLLVFVVAAAGMLLAATLLSDLTARPLRRLAEQANDLDLERLDVRFDTGRDDEAGMLARALDRAVDGLRAGARDLRESERRAALGDLARQINHDLRNGFIPLRNVFRHLLRVAEEQPARASTVILERRGSVESGLNYLEELAAGYRRISAAPDSEACDLNAVAARVVAAHRDGHVGTPPVVLAAAPSLPPVTADPTALRRILDNLVRNALDSLPDGPAEPVVVATAHEPDAELAVVLSVRDRGCGMDAATCRRAAELFYTTKTAGTGLGLAIVRRLAADAGGELEIASEPGEGTTVTLRFPAGDAPVEGP